ncbi:MAG: fumarylacetoacetate hydrolase family protein [Janthinobacterium lividum]
MTLVRFLKDGRPALGLRVGDEVVDLSSIEGHGAGDVSELLRRGPDALRTALAAARTSAPRLPAAGLHWLPLSSTAGKAVCLGLNYADHATETGASKPDYPILFMRGASSFVGHGEPLVRPASSTHFDFEGELVAFVGKRARHVRRADALSHISGYSVFNDGSIRDFQMRTSQWTMGKNFDGTGAFGPGFVPATELPPGAAGLRLTTRLNGQVMQQANTTDMVFDVAETVALLSASMTLEPGDLLIMGTPAGVGFTRQPPVFMKPGDVCEVEIEGVGLLRNPVVQEGA